MTKKEDDTAARAAAEAEAKAKEEQSRAEAEAKAKQEAQARKDREAAEAKANETKNKATAAQSSVMTGNANVLQAAQDHNNAVDEANRKAKEESDAKHKEMQRRDTEAGRALSNATQIAVAGPDRTGKVEGAAGYDAPKLSPAPGTDEWHMAHPGEITGGAFNPREQSAEDHAKTMGQVNTKDEGDKKTAA